MLFAAFAAVVAFAIGFGAAAWLKLRAAWRIGAIVGVLAGGTAFVLSDFEPTPPPAHQPRNLAASEFRPAAVSANGYVGAAACQECHPNNHASWHASYHRTMTQVATPQTALGDFDDATVTTPHDGRTYELTIQGDHLQVEVNTPDDLVVIERPDLPNPMTVVMSTGAHHMQVYWYATGQGRTLGMLPIVHLNEAHRWVPRSHLFLQPPSEIQSRVIQGHGADFGRWNSICIKCHATNGRPRLLGENTVDTQVADFGISCESCHGPGEQHISMQRLRLSGEGMDELDPIVNPRELSHQRSSEVCGQCHSSHHLKYPSTAATVNLHGFPYRPGDELAATILLAGQDEETHAWMATHSHQNEAEIAISLEHEFWSDGMVRVGGLEFTGLQASACYVNGTASCLSCHAMHPGADDPRELSQWANDQLRPGMGGDSACTQCHSDARYASDEHTHHVADSAGSRCMNCHMPHTSYALLKATRSHQISSPDVATAVVTGRPDACSLCHLSQPLSWTADRLADWYGKPVPELDADQSHIAAGVVWGLTGDAAQRALIAHSMGWDAAVEASAGNGWMAPCLSVLLRDPYAPVRYIAHRSLRRLAGFEEFEFMFDGRPDDWTEASQRAISIWEAQDGRVESPAVLIDGHGKLLDAEFQRLQRLRNDREVIVEE